MVQFNLKISVYNV